MSPLSPRTPSSSEEDNVFGSSEHVGDLSKSSNSLNSHDVEGSQDGGHDVEHGEDGDGYADIRHRDQRDSQPLLDSCGSKASLASKSSLLAKRKLDQLNGSIVSLSSQLSKQFRGLEDSEENSREENVGLLDEQVDQGSDDAFETGDIKNSNRLPEPSQGGGASGRPQNSDAMETSLDSGEIDPSVLIEYARPEKSNPPRRPSKQSDV